MNIDEYATSLHEIARECQLDTMYEDFVLQALLPDINNDQLRKELFDDTSGETGLRLEEAINKCRIAENLRNGMAAIQFEESVQFISFKKKLNRPNKNDDDSSIRSTRTDNFSKGSGGNCGQSHPPRKCLAYGHQCYNCKKYNHWRSQCRSKKQVNAVEEDSDGPGESLLSIVINLWV